MRIFLLSTLLFFSFQAHAGFIEIGAMGNLRDSSIDKDHTSKSRSITGSLAYYFFENSAIELSYTEGYQKSTGTTLIGVTNYNYTQIVNYTMYGADFILSFFGKESAFQPYLKAGIAQQKKQIEFEISSDVSKSEQEGNYLTGGVGFKIIMTKNISFKAGYDLWKGPLGKDDQTTDNATRVGLSFIF